MIWQTKRLIELCDIKPPQKEVRDILKDVDHVSFVPMENLGILTKKIVLRKEKRFCDVFGSYTYFANDDVLLAKITPCFENGKPGIARNLKNGIGFGSSEYIVFRSKGEILPDYLFYYLSRDKFRQDGKKLMTGAVGHKRVPKEFVENQEMLFPKSLPEQKRIVKILDKAFAAIDKAKENAEKNLKNAKELFDSYLQNIFANPGKDWEEKKLEEVTTKIGSGATPRGGKNGYKTEGLSLIRSLNIYDNGFAYKKLAFINKTQADKLSNVIVESGDILLNITGASICRCTIVPDDVLPARVNQHVSIIRMNKSEMIPKFLHYILISKDHKDRLLNIGEKAGATRQALTKNQLEEYTIQYPRYTFEQKRIVAKLNALSTKTKRLGSIYQQKLSELEELKQSVLQKVFEGEL